MRDAFFFLSLAGLGLSVAGFAGLVSAFRRRDEGWTRTELIDSAGCEIYGTPSDDVLQIMKRIADSGLPVRIHPQLVGGYLTSWPASSSLLSRNA